MSTHIRCVHAIDEYASRIGFVELHEQVGESRLPRSRRTNNRDTGTGGDALRESMYDLLPFDV